MLRLGLALAVLAASARPARACDCAALDEAEATRQRALVFDGWVLDGPQPWHCPLPPAPRPRPGCIRVAVVDREDCVVRGELFGLEPLDGQPRVLAAPALEDGMATLCGVPPGRYLLSARHQWVGGTENGSLDYGRTILVAPGGSYVAYAPGRTGQRLRVGVFRTLKGQLPREVVVRTENDCGTPYFVPGGAWRFFANAGDDGAALVKGCWGARQLTEPERAQPIGPPDAGVARPPPPTPPLPSPPAPPPAPSGCGCRSMAETAPGPAVLALLLLRRRRRRQAP